MTDHLTHAEQKPARDSIFGVCAALAGDFGFDPLWLRLAIGAGLMIDMEAALGAYVVLGMIVLVSRLVSPDGRATGGSATLAAVRGSEGEQVARPRAA